jgi:hypothetical protein
MPTQITNLSQCREGLRVCGILGPQRVPFKGQLHIYQPPTCVTIYHNESGDPIPLRAPRPGPWYESYSRTWTISVSESGRLEVFDTKLYVDDEIEPTTVQPPAPPDIMPGGPLRHIPLARARCRFDGLRVHGTLMGKPFSNGILKVRSHPAAVYVWQDVASFGRKYGDPPDAAHPKCWFIYMDKDSGILIPQPGTEIFTDTLPQEPSPDRFTADNPPGPDDLCELREITREDECEDDLPVWVKTYRGTICIGRLRQENDRWYICTDEQELDGSTARNRLGFVYSWVIAPRHNRLPPDDSLRLFYRPG